MIFNRFKLQKEENQIRISRMQINEKWSIDDLPGVVLAGAVSSILAVSFDAVEFVVAVVVVDAIIWLLFWRFVCLNTQCALRQPLGMFSQ